jgi:uncharacterized membrane protein YfcA
MAAEVLAPGLLIGAVLGLLGGGGSLLTVPIFVYVLGFEPKAAVAMSLVVIGVTSAVGTVGHSRAGNLNTRVGLLFAAVAAVGVVPGSYAGVLLPADLQLSMFALVMFIAAALMIARRPDATAEATQMAAPRGTLIAAGALGVGFLTGLLGVGGGFLLVPALVLLRLTPRQAVGTSLLVITVNCAVGLSSYVGHVQLAWSAVALVAAATVPGIALGTYLHRFVPARILRPCFAAFLVLAGTGILYQRLAPAVLGR